MLGKFIGIAFILLGIAAFVLDYYGERTLLFAWIVGGGVLVMLIEKHERKN
jgi:hypothetical protein|tara:strand:- start:330 stop:482 length:153 start_codon:yes stop_codon:yes gene_type:complete